jgi:hypothetical protein
VTGLFNNEPLPPIIITTPPVSYAAFRSLFGSLAVVPEAATPKKQSDKAAVALATKYIDLSESSAVASVRRKLVALAAEAMRTLKSNSGAALATAGEPIEPHPQSALQSNTKDDRDVAALPEPPEPSDQTPFGAWLQTRESSVDFAALAPSERQNLYAEFADGRDEGALLEEAKAAERTFAAQVRARAAWKIAQKARRSSGSGKGGLAASLGVNSKTFGKSVASLAHGLAHGGHVPVTVTLPCAIRQASVPCYSLFAAGRRLQSFVAPDAKQGAEPAKVDVDLDVSPITDVVQQSSPRVRSGAEVSLPYGGLPSDLSRIANLRRALPGLELRRRIGSFITPSGSFAILAELSGPGADLQFSYEPTDPLAFPEMTGSTGSSSQSKKRKEATAFDKAADFLTKLPQHNAMGHVVVRIVYTCRSEKLSVLESEEKEVRVSSGKSGHLMCAPSSCLWSHIVLLPYALFAFCADCSGKGFRAAASPATPATTGPAIGVLACKRTGPHKSCSGSKAIRFPSRSFVGIWSEYSRKQEELYQ